MRSNTRGAAPRVQDLTILPPHPEIFLAKERANGLFALLVKARYPMAKAQEVAHDKD